MVVLIFMLWISVSVEISIVNKSSSTPDADSGQTDYLSRSRSIGGVNTVANGVILLFILFYYGYWTKPR